MTKCYMIMLKDNLLPDITETDIFSNYKEKAEINELLRDLR